MIRLLVLKDIMLELLDILPNNIMLSNIIESLYSTNAYEINIENSNIHFENPMAVIDIEYYDDENIKLIVADFPNNSLGFISIDLNSLFDEFGENIHSITIFNEKVL